MPTVSPKDPYLTVLNVFFTDAPEKQERLLDEMRAIVDTAAFPGWISSTVHAGQDKPGTANFIQWRSSEDLQARYAGEKFKHHTVPLFAEMTQFMMLLQNQVAYAQTRPGAGGAVEVSPDRDDLTAIEFFGLGADAAVGQAGQAEVVDALGPGGEWLLEVPGYRSHAVLRGVGARGYEGAFVVRYSQWDSLDAFHAFRDQPEADQPEGRRKAHARVNPLVTRYEWNTYRVVHTRSANPTSEGKS